MNARFDLNIGFGGVPVLIGWWPSERFASADVGNQWDGHAIEATIFVKSIASMQVSWWDCHVFMTEMVKRTNCGPVPWPGTPAWCAMADDDPRKLLALAGFGVYQALSVDAWQKATAEASSEISAGENWSQVARSNLRRTYAIRSGAYIPKKATA
jgi:hypothetical protein